MSTLRTTEISPFQTGGALQQGRLYVERQADRELYTTLKRGEFCYVLAPRQIGKSSLRVRTARRLEEEGVRCASVELTGKGTEEQWYFGLVKNLWNQLQLPGDERDYWKDQKMLAPSERFLVFLSEIVLAQIPEPVTIFVDEIDTTLDLPFPRDDFFASIRSTYNARADRPAFQRLTFCLIGVITPGDLIEDPTRTPFNVGRGIRLEDFERRQMDALLPGLEGLGGDPKALLDAIYEWTSGHPYMTQRLCDALVEQGPDRLPEQRRIHRLVDALFLRHGRTRDPNLAATDEYFTKKAAPKAAENAAVSSEGQLAKSDAPPWYERYRTAMLQVYRRLLSDQPEPAQSGDPVQMALRLTGIAAERRESTGMVFRVRNRVFGEVFNSDWLKEQEEGRLIADTLALWMRSGKQDDYLLRGQQLKEGQEWADQQTDLTRDERQFLDRSRVAEQREEQEKLRQNQLILEEQRQKEVEQRRRAEERAKNAIKFRWLSVVLALLLFAAIWAEQRAKSSARQAQASAQQERIARKKADAAASVERQAEQQATTSARQAAQSAETARKAERQATASARQAKEATRREQAARQRADKEATRARKAEAQAKASATQATHQRQVALSGSLAANSLLHPDTPLSLLFAAKAAAIWPGEAAKSALQHALLYGRVLGGHADAVNGAGFSPDGRTVATASNDHTARLWQAGTGRLLRTLAGHTDSVNSAAFSPDGRTIATASSDHAARLWQAGTGRLLRTLAGHTGPVNSAAFSPDGRTVLTASGDHTARLWQTGTGRLLRTLAGHTGPVYRAAFSPDGRTVLTASSDNTARLWQAGTGRLLHTLAGHAGPVIGAAFSPDGRTVLTASYDHTARLWQTGTGRLLHTLAGHTDSVNSAAFSPDGKTVLTASDDHTARLWQAGTGRLLHTLAGHTDSVNSAAFSPDGRTVLTASGDHTARLWQAGTGRLLRTLAGHADSVIGAAFSPDGRTVLTASGDHTARLYYLPILDRPPAEKIDYARKLVGQSLTPREQAKEISPYLTLR